jgi:hypothetical protein
VPNNLRVPAGELGYGTWSQRESVERGNALKLRISGHNYGINDGPVLVRLGETVLFEQADNLGSYVNHRNQCGERGYFLHPELFGQPQERSIFWAPRYTTPGSRARATDFDVFL